MQIASNIAKPTFSSFWTHRHTHAYMESSAFRSPGLGSKRVVCLLSADSARELLPGEQGHVAPVVHHVVIRAILQR